MSRFMTAEDHFNLTQSKLKSQIQTSSILTKPINTTHISDAGIAVLRVWIAQRVKGILNMEDDIIVNLIINEINRARKDKVNKGKLDGPGLQVLVTPFLTGSSQEFTTDLYRLLINAANNADGIPDLTILNRARELLESRTRAANDTSNDTNTTGTSFDPSTHASTTYPPGPYANSFTNTTDTTDTNVAATSSGNTTTHCNTRRIGTGILNIKSEGEDSTLSGSIKLEPTSSSSTHPAAPTHASGAFNRNEPRRRGGEEDDDRRSRFEERDREGYRDHGRSRDDRDNRYTRDRDTHPSSSQSSTYRSQRFRDADDRSDRYSRRESPPRSEHRSDRYSRRESPPRSAARGDERSDRYGRYSRRESPPRSDARAGHSDARGERDDRYSRRESPPRSHDRYSRKDSPPRSERGDARGERSGRYRRESPPRSDARGEDRSDRYRRKDSPPRSERSDGRGDRYKP